MWLFSWGSPEVSNGRVATFEPRRQSSVRCRTSTVPDLIFCADMHRERERQNVAHPFAFLDMVKEVYSSTVSKRIDLLNHVLSPWCYQEISAKKALTPTSNQAWVVIHLLRYRPGQSGALKRRYLAGGQDTSIDGHM